MIDLGKQDVEISCPNCGSKIHLKLNKVARHDTVICHSCSQSIQLLDSGGSARKSIRDVNKAFKDLEKTF